MRLSLFIFITLTAVPLRSYPQIKIMTVDQYLELGRDSIISLAFEEIKSRREHPDFRPGHFDRIRVMAGQESVYVTFGMSFNYVPSHSAAYYGAYVNLTDRMTSFTALRNPDGYSPAGNLRFYVPDNTSEKARTFITSVLGEEMIDPVRVYDHRKYYRIESGNKDIYFGFKIKKSSGEIFDEFHEHLLVAPDDEEELFREIK
jgi:hypothetical protein